MKTFFLFSLIMQLHQKPTERQVLLFYTNSGKEVWEKQMAELRSHEAGVKERDILITSFNTRTKDDAKLRQWKVDPAKKFTFILVGRDGGDKFRSGELVRADQLFSLVDAMPMRKNEIKIKRQ